MSERHSHDGRWTVLVIVCIAQFMVILDATVVNVALPSIQSDLQFSQADLQWVINAYTLMFGGFLLLGGRAGDLIGRRRLFIWGTLLFTLASALNGLATSAEWLVAARGLQGLGAALVSPARPEGFDLAGAVSVTAGLIVLVYAIVKAESFGCARSRSPA